MIEGMVILSFIRAVEACILILSGASSMEELSQEQVDGYMYYQHHPLKINSAGQAALARSGLLSAYQAASIVDYRRRCGDILSPAELAAVDGIGGLYAQALAPFVSLESSRPLGERVRDSLRVRTDVYSRGQVRERTQTTLGSFAGKLRITAEGPFDASASLCTRTALSEKPWTSGVQSFCATAGGQRFGLVLGDFNLRFGQGAGLWSGFMLSGYPTVNSFCRNPTSASPSFTYESAHRGCAFDLRLGNCEITAAMSLPGLAKRMGGDKRADIDAMPVIGANWIWRRAQLGSSASAVIGPDGSVKASHAGVDFKLSRGMFDFFGECVGAIRPEMQLRTVMGCFLNAGYQHRYGIVGRYLPKDRGVAIGAHYKGLDSVLDCMRNPSNGKSRVKYSLDWTSSGKSPLSVSVRWQEQLRPEDNNALRSELRADIGVALERLRMTLRLDGILGESAGGLGYLECGYVHGCLKAYVRGTVYDTSGWADRIYCYERDVPGSFSVPAFYGRGWRAAAVVSCRRPVRRYGHIQLCLKADTTPEAKLSLVVAL